MMPPELITGLAVFAFVSSITPGPNNLMLMTSGANFGLRRTLPHLLGVVLGFCLMIVLVGLGIMQLFSLYPASFDVLKIASIVYLFYLAGKTAFSRATLSDQADTTEPMTFIQAVLFQWVNPKAWTMALTAISVYAPSQGVWPVLVVALFFSVINLPCVSCWIVLGQKIRYFLTSTRRLKVFNVVMAGLLVASVIPALSF